MGNLSKVWTDYKNYVLLGAIVAGVTVGGIQGGDSGSAAYASEAPISGSITPIEVKRDVPVETAVGEIDTSTERVEG